MSTFDVRDLPDADSQIAATAYHCISDSSIWRERPHGLTLNPASSCIPESILLPLAMLSQEVCLQRRSSIWWTVSRYTWHPSRSALGSNTSGSNPITVSSVRHRLSVAAWAALLSPGQHGRPATISSRHPPPRQMSTAAGATTWSVGLQDFSKRAATQKENFEKGERQKIPFGSLCE